MRDIYLAGTQGERNRNARLTDDVVRAIRAEYARGLRGGANAKRWGISPGHYNALGRGDRWPHLKN